MGSHGHYIPSTYYTSPHLPYGHSQLVATTERPEPQRKRPKYTRSKTGCLTCRVKKIKCDETKPNCLRCTHSQRDCTWPQGVSTVAKKTPARSLSLDSENRPSTASSATGSTASSFSDSSTPPTRGPTPPQRVPADIGLPPMVTRRTDDLYTLHQPLHPEPNPSRRQIDTPRYIHQPIPSIPSVMPFHTPRYHQHSSSYPDLLHPISEARSAMPAPRELHHSLSHHWVPPPLLVPQNGIDNTCYHSSHDRVIVDHSISHHRHRYD